MAVGAISGTSMDGVDVAMIETDGEGSVVRGPSHMRPYTDGERATIAAAQADGMAAPHHRHRTDALRAAEAVVTHAHREAIEALIMHHQLSPGVIGWHGQTVAHAPERRMTMQLGNPQAMADALNANVVFDLRQADIASGGEGAPLVPIYHRALAQAAGLQQPLLVINLGGVANITFIDGETLIAFDTGPASAMVDDAVAAVGQPYDEGGALAAQGQVDQGALKALLDHPYFKEPPPKSLDRDAFGAGPVQGLALEDKVATLTRFSAEAIGRAAALLPRPPSTVIAAGGGTHNRTLMGFIADAVQQPIRSADDVGFSSDFMEAEAFAYLAVRSLHGAPITFPGTTGVEVPLTGGRVFTPNPGAA